MYLAVNKQFDFESIREDLLQNAGENTAAFANTCLQRSCIIVGTLFDQCSLDTFGAGFFIIDR